MTHSRRSEICQPFPWASPKLSWPSPSCINDKIHFLQYTRASQYYENSKYISNLFFVMLYTYILDDSIKSPTLILRTYHSTLLFLPGFFYQIKNFLFLLWENLYMITGIYLHDPPPFKRPFFMTSPFLSLKKLWPSLCFHPPTPPTNFWQVP